MPWSTAFRTRCTSGSPMRSITFLSSSVSAPLTSRLTCLPLALARSRTTRWKRLNTVAMGSIRAVMMPSWSSWVMAERAWIRLSRSRKALVPPIWGRRRSVEAANPALWITSSPTRFRSESSFWTDTRTTSSGRKLGPDGWFAGAARVGRDTSGATRAAPVDAVWVDSGTPDAASVRASSTGTGSVGAGSAAASSAFAGCGSAVGSITVTVT